MKIQIVDEQDNVIGVKERSEIDYAKDIYRVPYVSNHKAAWSVEILNASSIILSNKTIAI